MKYRLFLVFSIQLLFLSTIKCQNIEWLLGQLNASQTLEDRKVALQNIAFAYQNTLAFNKAVEYYSELLVILNKNPSDSVTVKVLKNIAFCYDQLNFNTKLIETYTELLKVQKSLKLEVDAIETMKSLSSYLIQEEKYLQAQTINIEILGLLKKHKDDESLASIYNNLGYISKKLNNDSISIHYFSLCKKLVHEPNSTLEIENKIKILINLGIVHTEISKFSQALTFFNEAYDLSVTAKNNVEIANTINYLAAYDFKTENYRAAEEKLTRSINLNQHNVQDIRSRNVLLASYKIYCELLFATEKYTKFKYFNTLYNTLKDEILNKEKLQNQFLAQQQIEIEYRENQIRNYLAEKEKQVLLASKAEAEHEKTNQYFKLKVKELVLLKKNQEIQSMLIMNQRLEQEKLAHLLQITQQKEKNLEHQRQIELLEKEQIINQLSITEKKKNIEILNLQRKATSQKLDDSEKIRNYVTAVVALLSVLLVLIFFGYRNNLNKNKLLQKQQQTIEERNKEIEKQNLDLYMQNSEMEALSEELTQQNDALSETQIIISKQNEKLQQYNESLESMVAERTKDLKNMNEELIQHSNQLEQFAFIISHNIRAPLARLLGLINVLEFLKVEDKKVKSIIEKISTSSNDLDIMVRDLNRILEIKKGLNEIYSKINLFEIVNKISQRLEKQIIETEANIVVDFDQKSEIYSVTPYIESIFYNLISNSIKYRSPKKKPEIKISSEIENDTIHISFKDNGIGIDLDENGDKIFGMYQRFNSQTEGKGLGLYLVKTQIEALGGKIDLISKINKGILVKISLQMKEKPELF